MTRRRGLTPRWSWSLTLDPRMRRASPNYGFETCPADEYEFVVAPRNGVYYPHTPRYRRLWPCACHLEHTTVGYLCLTTYI